jgi:hypothetical protein
MAGMAPKAVRNADDESVADRFHVGGRSNATEQQRQNACLQELGA